MLNGFLFTYYASLHYTLVKRYILNANSQLQEEKTLNIILKLLTRTL